MKKGASKQKGNKFEIDIAKKLSLLWSNGNEDDIFWRSQTSGGRATVRNRAGKTTEKQVGDLTYDKPEGKPLIDNWCFELKSGYSKISKKKKDEGALITKSNWCILDLLDSKQKETTFEAFWIQCLEAAKLVNRTPILIFKRNNKSACITLPHKEFKKLNRFFNVYNYSTITLNNLIILNFEEFSTWVSPNFKEYFIQPKFKKLKKK